MPKTLSIAVIDDDGSVREAMSDLIRLLGYEAESFGSAEELLGCDRIGDISCLVADVQMPGMSGLQLYERLQAIGQAKPVIFITAFPHEGVRERALASGAIGYLSKPVDTDHFVDCLRKAVGEAASGGCDDAFGAPGGPRRQLQ